MSSGDGYVVLTLLFEKDEMGRWLAECKELGTAIFAYSLDQAVTVIKEAVELHLNTLELSGERERFFKENNIPLHGLPKAENRVSLNVPLRQDVLVQSYVHQFAMS